MTQPGSETERRILGDARAAAAQTLGEGTYTLGIAAIPPTPERVYLTMHVTVVLSVAIDVVPDDLARTFERFRDALEEVQRNANGTFQ